jgi:hypothetical protein
MLEAAAVVVIQLEARAALVEGVMVVVAQPLELLE